MSVVENLVMETKKKDVNLYRGFSLTNGYIVERATAAYRAEV